MAPRPTEIKAVATILDPDASDEAKAMAVEIIETLDELRLKREQYSVVYWEPNTRTLASFGPYGTELQARKAMGKLASPGPLPGKGEVTRLATVRD